VNARQAGLLERIKERGEVGRAEYVEMFQGEVSLSALYWDLRELREWGMVKKVRRGRGSYYSL
jgi:DNA-binding transcriptional ArsR family regulator